jgi:probable rRNA maturation factor
VLIDIQDLQNNVKLDKKKIVNYAKSVLRDMGENKAELSLVFVDDSYIKRLNWKYRKVDSTTDVLAFSMREGGKALSKNSAVLGDVVISTETAKREAKKRNISIRKEIYLYLLHGILHLLGYDDTKCPAKKIMRAKEKELLAII